jgi:hypothetical protein
MCNKETKNISFCSRKCSNTFQGINNPPRKGTGKGTPICKICNINHLPGYGYKLCTSCSASRFIYSSDPTIGELKDYYKNCKHSTGMQSYIRSNARSTFSQKEKPICTNCTYNRHVEVCHIKPIRSFTDDSRLSEINNETNLVYLCPNCHWEFDNGLITISKNV